MKNDIGLVRAIASVMLRRHGTRLFVLPAAIIVCCLVAVVWFMSHYGGWWAAWLILLIPLFVLTCGAWIVSILMARLLAPRRLTKSEQHDVSGFADRVMALTGQAQTPLPFMGIRLVWDMLVHKDFRTLRGLIETSATLRSDYQTLRNKLN